MQRRNGGSWGTSFGPMFFTGKGGKEWREVNLSSGSIPVRGVGGWCPRDGSKRQKSPAVITKKCRKETDFLVKKGRESDREATADNGSFIRQKADRGGGSRECGL